MAWVSRRPATRTISANASAPAISAIRSSLCDHDHYDRTSSVPSLDPVSPLVRSVRFVEVDVNRLNSSFDITDVRDSGNSGVGLMWSRGWSSRIHSDISLGYSRYDDVRERSARVGSNNNPSAAPAPAVVRIPVTHPAHRKWRSRAAETTLTQNGGLINSKWRKHLFIEAGNEESSPFLVETLYGS